MNVEEIEQALHRLCRYVVVGDVRLTGFSDSDWQKLVTMRRWRDLMLFNYTNFAQYQAQWTDLLRICRGVVLTQSGELVSLPFVKFFNLGEHVDTTPAAVAKWSLRSVTEKVDGVMVQLFLHHGQLVWASRHGIFTPAAQLARDIAGSGIESIVRHIPYARWTLVMELVHRDVWQPGMVHPGDEAGLYLLYVRNLDTLEFTPACEIFSDSLRPPFRLPKQYAIGDLQNALRLIQSIDTPDWEGIVLQGGESGNLLVKLKSPLYVRRLALLKGLSPKRLLSTYQDGGWSAVASLLVGIEEVVDQTPLGDIMEMILQAERSVQQALEAYRDVPREQIQSVPVEWRWVVGYRDNPEKLQRAIRKSAVAIVEKQMAGPWRSGIAAGS